MSSRARQRARRSDAAQNQDALVRAATTAVHREGLRVPMATIAAEAGVGVGTLYRHFATREQLLTYLTHRSFEQVLANARAADREASTGSDALRRFIDATITQRNQLVLPLHGGPAVTATETVALRDQVHDAIGRLIERGRIDGSITHELRADDIIAFGAMLAQPRSSDPTWDATCRRVLDVYLNGLSTPRRSP